MVVVYFPFNYFLTCVVSSINFNFPFFFIQPYTLGYLAPIGVEIIGSAKTHNPNLTSHDLIMKIMKNLFTPNSYVLRINIIH